MRRVYLVLLVGTAAATGCMFNKSKKHDMTHPKVEEFNPPPNEARYNNPPEDRYRKPPVSKDLASRPGAMGGGGPMMMNGGPGGQ